MTKILVTGATSNVGRYLIPLLRKAGADVLAGSTKGMDFDGVKGVVVDFLKPETLRAAFKNVDILYVVLTPFSDKIIEMGDNIATAAKEAGVKYIIRMSGAGADPNSPYLMAKEHGIIDKKLKDTGIPCTFLEDQFFMQNYINWAKDMIKGGAYYSAEGQGLLAMIDARDIADVAAEIILHPDQHKGKSYVLSGSEAVTNEDVMKLISKELGRQIQHVDIPHEAAAEAMKGMGMNDTAVERFVSMDKATVKGLYSLVTDNVKKITGHEPRTIAAFVKENADLWR